MWLSLWVLSLGADFVTVGADVVTVGADFVTVSADVVAAVLNVYCVNVLDIIKFLSR